MYEHLAFGQIYLSSDSIHCNRVILVKVSAKTIRNGGTTRKFEYSFKTKEEDLFGFETFSNLSDESMGIIGRQQSCLCVGDSISFSLKRINIDSAKDSLDSWNDDLHFVNTSIFFPNKNNQSKYRLRPYWQRKNESTRIFFEEENVIVGVKNQFYYLQVEKPYKIYMPEYSGKGCQSCIQASWTQ